MVTAVNVRNVSCNHRAAVHLCMPVAISTTAGFAIYSPNGDCQPRLAHQLPGTASVCRKIKVQTCAPQIQLSTKVVHATRHVRFTMQ